MCTNPCSGVISRQRNCPLIPFLCNEFLHVTTCLRGPWGEGRVWLHLSFSYGQPCSPRAGEKTPALNAGLGAREPVAMPLYSGDSGRGRQNPCRRRDRPDWPRPLCPLGGALQGETALIGHGRCARLAGLQRQTPLPASVGENAVCRTAGVACEYHVDATGSYHDTVPRVTQPASACGLVPSP